MTTLHEPDPHTAVVPVGEPYDDDQFRAGMSPLAPFGALFAGLLVFSLFVYGASRSEHADAPQQTAQQQHSPAPTTTR